MLQLQHSYQLQDVEMSYARGCATDRHVAFSTTGGATHVLSSSSAEFLYTRHDEPTWASCLEIISFSSDPSDEVLMTTHNSLIKVYTLATGAPRLDFPDVHQGHIDLFKVFQGPGNGINAENRTLLASVDSEGLIALWVLLAEGPKLLHTLKGHSQTARNICLLPSNQKLLVSAAYEGTVRVWDIESGAQILECQFLDGHERMLSSPDSQESRNIIRTTVHVMVATPDGRIIFGGGSGYVRVWNANTGEVEKSWQAHFGGNRAVGPIVNKILLHPSGDAFVTTGTDGRIRLWDLGTYECIREIKPFEHSTLPSSIAWADNTLLCAGKDGSPANACGDFCRVIEWDLTKVRLDDGATEECRDIVPSCNFVHSLWVFECRVVIAAQRKGRGVIEVWSRQ